MPNVPVRNLSQTVLDALKKRAARNGRSLQEELRPALEYLARMAQFDYAQFARQLREEIARYAPCQSDSAEIIRQDRGPPPRGHPG